MINSKQMNRLVKVLPALFLCSCVINNYTADRAEMIGKNEMEVCAGASSSIAFLDESYGGGVSLRYGVNSRVTLGLSGDANINRQGADWAPDFIYTKFTFEQKFALFPDKIPDVVALKLKQGFSNNNYTGEVFQNPTTMEDELITPTSFFPYLGAELFYTIPYRYSKAVTTTFIARGLYGQSRFNEIYSYGLAIGFEKFAPGPNRRFLAGLEFGTTLFNIDGTAEMGIQVGIHFSIFKGFEKN